MPDEPDRWLDEAGDGDPTAGAELDWDLDDLERFMAEADPDYVAPVDVVVESDE